MEDAVNDGAAVLGVPVKPTIKEVGSDMLVQRTLVRSKLWDVQTPQVCQLEGMVQLRVMKTDSALAIVCRSLRLT